MLGSILVDAPDLLATGSSFGPVIGHANLGWPGERYTGRSSMMGEAGSDMASVLGFGGAIEYLVQ
jgi:hypothetical protein